MNLHGILKKGQGRRLFAVSAVAALGLAIGAAPSMAVDDNVLFCHATSSITNPYKVGIQTDPDAIIKAGHGDHIGPVFNLTGGKDQPTWGDIIPAFDYGDSQHFDGLNLDAAGEGFLARKCKLPVGPYFSDLTLVKVVVNTGGGPALATDWDLDAVGTTEGLTAFAGGPTGVTHEVVEGTYTLSELPAATTNYTASGWDCTNTDVNGTTVVIGPNDRDVTCTITNTFIPPEPHTALLTLVKVVVNTGGGPALATDWDLDAVATPEAMNPFAEGTTGVHQQVADGTYTLSELPAATTNYTASAWDCTNTEENGTTVVIGPNDESVTCTITNTFVVPLVVDKEVTPAASATQGTCDAAGKVTLVTKTGYSWSENTGTATDPIYTATAAKGYVLTRSGKFTFHGLGRLPSDSAECVVAPAPVVAGVVENAPVVAGVVENAPAVKSLAFTGAETIPLGLSGLLALVLGAVLTVASRQRPKQARE